MKSIPHTSASPASGARTTVATLTGNLYLVFGTLLFSLLAFLLCWLPSRTRVVFWFARLWSRGVLFFGGSRLECASAVELEPSSGYIFMANHQSLFDIPALLASAPFEIRFLAKRSLFQIPFFGWVLKAGGFVSIDRASRKRAQSGFAEALRELRSGASLLIFPEGTRSFDGRLLPFKRGGLLLALRSGLPIVPVGIRGTLEIRSRGSYLIRPGTAVVRYGRPIDPAPYGLRTLEALGADLRDRIVELMGSGC